MNTQLTEQDLRGLEELLAKAIDFVPPGLNCTQCGRPMPNVALMTGNSSSPTARCECGCTAFIGSFVTGNTPICDAKDALFDLAPQLIAAAKVGLEKGTGAQNCAWLHFTGCGELDDGCHKRLVTCDSDSPGAFKVYRHPPAASVPTGWKLVPVEPTEEMIAAMLRETHADETGCIYQSEMRDGYNAMLAAAPLPPPKG